MEETIKALWKHELRLRRLEAGLLAHPWPTPSLQKRAVAMSKTIRKAICQIQNLRDILERIEKEE